MAQILDITNDIKWIGTLDPDLRVFDIVMHTPYGTTYNSYFIQAEQSALIEATKEYTWEAYLNNVQQLCNPNDLKYVVVNHTEPDHAGNVKNLILLNPNITVVGSGTALKYLEDILGIPFKSLKVKDGDTLSLGNKTLQFIGAPNLHWPDSMYTYVQEDHVLFTCDSFGAHYCHQAMYDDLVGNFDDAFKYYFDVILKPFSKYMLKAIQKIRPLEIQAICTGHGPILRSNWEKYVDLTEQYAQAYLASRIENKILVLYVSAYDYTGLLAEKITEGILQVSDVVVETLNIQDISPAMLEEKITEASAILIGSPTINQNTLLQIYTTFALINPLRDRNKQAGAFGSYGWSGEAEKIIQQNLSALKLNYTGGLFIKFKPHEKDYTTFINFGKSFAERLLEDNNKTCSHEGQSHHHHGSLIGDRQSLS